MSTLVVHIGAGRHSLQLRGKHRQLLSSALAQLFIPALRILEELPLTNTGFGLLLDLNGDATCDATVAHVRQGELADLLLLHGIWDSRHPTVLCELVMTAMDLFYGPSTAANQMGLSKPAMLSYAAARRTLLVLRALDKAGQDTLVSAKQKATHQRYLPHLEWEGLQSEMGAQEPEGAKAESLDDESAELDVFSSTGRTSTPETPLLRAHNPLAVCNLLSKDDGMEERLLPEVEDTIGLVELSGLDFNISALTGGNVLKFPGRILCAGIYGAGLAFHRERGVEVCCLCSGNGDDIVRMGLALHVAQELALAPLRGLGAHLVRTVQRRGAGVQLQAVDADGNRILYVGIIAVVKTPDAFTLVYCHSTETFYFGFRSNGVLELVLSSLDGATGTFVHGEYKL